MPVKVTERFPDGFKNVIEGMLLKEDGQTIKVCTKHGVREILERRTSSIESLPRGPFECRPHES